MKKTIVKYTDNPDLPDLKHVEIVNDFLPRPEDLVFREPAKKVTISLNVDSLQFFKKEAARLKTPYQRMIRNLLQEYVTRMRK